MKLPAIQFYPGDWKKDPGVQSLTYEEKGIWIEILFLMFESETRGKLLLNGKPYPEDRLANMLNLDKQILTTRLTSLLDLGVASLCPVTGALMSRRMVRDEVLRKTRAECGKMGGNPDLLKQKTTTGVKVKPTPSASASASASTISTPIVPITDREALRVLLCGFFKRTPERQWSDKEKRSFSKFTPSQEEIEVIQNYYTAVISEGDYRRKDVYAFLNNWQGEVDRGRKFLSDHPKADSRILIVDDWHFEPNFLISRIHAQDCARIYAKRFSRMDDKQKEYFLTTANPAQIEALQKEIELMEKGAECVQ